MLSLNFFRSRSKKNIEYIKSNHAGTDGLACVAMLYSHYNLGSPIDVLNSYHKISEKFSIESMIQLLSINEKKFNAFQADVENLSEIELPAILFWKYNQFVVLAEIEIKKGDVSYLVYDPLKNKKWHKFEEISIYFSGIVLTSDEH